MKTHLIFGAFLGAALALVGPLAGEGRGDFTLTNDTQLTVNTKHSSGWLYNQSHAHVVSGGPGGVLDIEQVTIGVLDATGSLLYEIPLAPNPRWSWFQSWSLPDGRTHIGANLDDFFPKDRLGHYTDDDFLFTVEFRDTSITKVQIGPCGYNANTSYGKWTDFRVNHIPIWNGQIFGNLFAAGHVGEEIDIYNVAISGGLVGALYTRDSSSADISGGWVGELCAFDSSTVTFLARDFQLGDGLSLDGDRLLGTGYLSGEWFDGSLWTTYIGANASGATILALPEPATLSLLALGGLVALRRRR